MIVGDAIGEFRTFTIGWFDTMGLAAFREPRHTDALYSDFVELTGLSYRPKTRHLVFMGGLALNCVSNSTIVLQNGTREPHVTPEKTKDPSVRPPSAHYDSKSVQRR